MTRLIYETAAGDLSPSITFAQLLEYIQLAEEDAKRMYSATLDFRWKLVAVNFSNIHTIVNELNGNKTITSVGYTGHA